VAHIEYVRVVGSAHKTVILAKVAHRLSEAEPLSEPVGKPVFVNIMGCHCKHGLFSLVDIGRVRISSTPVQVDKHDKGRPRGSLVAIGQGMVPCQPACENRRLVDEVGVEVLIAEPCLRGVESRIGQFRP